MAVLGLIGLIVGVYKLMTITEKGYPGDYWEYVDDEDDAPAPRPRTRKKPAPRRRK